MITATNLSNSIEIRLGEEASIEFAKKNAMGRSLHGSIAHIQISFEPDSSLNFDYNVFYDQKFRGTVESNWLGKATIHLLDENNKVRLWRIKNKGSFSKRFFLVDQDGVELVRMIPKKGFRFRTTEYVLEVNDSSKTLAEAAELCLFCVMGARMYNKTFFGTSVS